MKTEWSEGVQKAWVCYEIFRRLGFSPDQISYGVVQGTAYGTIAQVVRVQIEADGTDFGVHVALWTGSKEQFQQEWDEFGDGLVSKDPATQIGESVLRGMYEKHVREFDPSTFVAAITRKGIRIPTFAEAIESPGDLS